MTTSKKTPREVVWTTAFLGITTAAVAMEVYAAVRRHEHYPAWTTLTVRHVPKPLALAAAAYLATWLPIHLFNNFRRHGKLSVVY